MDKIIQMKEKIAKADVCVCVCVCAYVVAYINLSSDSLPFSHSIAAQSWMSPKTPKKERCSDDLIGV